MPIISQIRKGSWKLKSQVSAIYLVLALGAVTMIYPFLVMVSGSCKSAVDANTFDIVPRYFYDREELFRKYTEARYSEDALLYNAVSGAGALNFSEVRAPRRPAETLVQAWRAFLARAELPGCSYQLEQTHSVGYMPYMRRAFTEYAFQQYHGELTAYNRAFNSTLSAWFYLSPPKERFLDKSYANDDSAAFRLYNTFKQAQPAWRRIYLSVGNTYRYGYLALKYGSTIDAYNAAYGTHYRHYREIALPETLPADPRQQAEWTEFVRNNLSRVFIEPLPQYLPAFQALLAKKYDGKIAKLNHVYRTSYRSFAEVPFPADRSIASAAQVDYDSYVTQADLRQFRLTGPDILFRRYLRQQYHDVASLNLALGTDYRAFAEVDIPVAEADWQALREHEGAIRHEFITRNYSMVLSYILLHGRGAINTLIFVLLSITIALTINPISAYALSRFNLPSTYKILLFMMATMAFPAAVTMIPNFLLLKELHLLNTFWALVLPGIANGYSIFLLKGFFDSLPRELYEAGMLDGAGEWTMFWKFTMTLSTPILAVIALGAFGGAYGAFMYAFTVCQDQNMWTLMVWLFKLQANSATPVNYAALTLAAVPTLIVFVLSQNVIMRGIVVPQEK